MIIENPLYLLLSIAAVPLLYQAYRAERTRGRFISISYVLIILTLSMAASSPQLPQDTVTTEENRLVVLQDQSASMLADERELNVDDVTVDRKTIATGNSSPIRQSMLALLEPNTTYLVDSDMQEDADFQKVEQAYSQAGSRINFVKRDMKSDKSVSVQGPARVVPNSENRFTVEIQSTKDEFQRPEVYVDGESVDLEAEDDNTFLFNYEFSETGTHRIRAEIPEEDIYERNNEYFKSVKVIERPEVLIVGEKGEIGPKIEQYFNPTYRESIPDQLSNYYSVILKEKQNSESLENYVYNGNGLLYTGKGTMDILPIEEHNYTDPTDNPKIIIGIDNSQGAIEGNSYKCSVGESIKESKELGTSLISSLASQRPESIVGAFAYNNTVWQLGELQPLSNENHRDRLLGTSTQGGIPSIPVCGTAYQIRALKAAKKLIGDSPGNIVLITDGKMPNDGGIFRYDLAYESLDLSEEEYQEEALDVADKLSINVTLHTVAVGEEPETAFLKELSKAGSSGTSHFYNGVEQFYALENTFRGGGGSRRKSIGVVNPNHFITEDLGRLSSTITDIEDMRSKPSAQTLVETSDNRPFLSTWRYGLGRVAAFSGDGSDLSNVMNQEPVLFSRTLNWAVGNPERKDNGSVNVESARKGQEVVLTSSNKRNGFVRVAQDRYRATVQPEKIGFQEHLGYEFAYNYRPEIKNLGYREELMDSMAEATGGKVYENSSLKGIKKTVKTREIEKVSTLKLTPHLLVIALILFLLQVGIRKSKGWI